MNGLQQALITFTSTIATLGIVVVVAGVAVVFAYAIIRGSMRP